MATCHLDGAQANHLTAELSKPRLNIKIRGRIASHPRRRWFGFLAVISAISFAVCAWFNFVYPHPNVSYVGDAGIYLEEARLVERLFNVYDIVRTEKVSKLSRDHGLYIAKTMCRLPDFRANGPVFPIAIAITYRLTGQEIGTIVNGWFISNYYIAVLAQCTLVAANCALLGFLGSLLWNRRCGSITAVLALIYPAFIVNTGRITTETLGTTTVISIALCSAWIVRSRGVVGPLVFGVLLSLMQLTRSAMVLLWLTVVPTIALGSGRTKWRSILLIIIGSGMILAPWLIWQKSRFGDFNLLVDRAGKYNLVIGHDTTRAGWLTMPHPIPSWANASSPPRIVWRCLKEHPGAWLSIQLDKPARLFKNTWNDFAQSIGAIPVAAQNLFHQWLLLMAGIGMTVNFWTKRREDLIPRLVLLEILATHAVYVVFTPVGRYNLTAMPAVLLIAAAGIDALLESLMSHERARQLQATVLAILSLLSLLVLRFGSLAYHGILPEGFSPLTPYVVPLLGLIVLVSIAYIAWKLIPKGMHLPARATCLLLAVILIPLATLPLRAHGRPQESSTNLSKPVWRTITIPTDLGTDRDYYLAIDASDGLSLCNDLAVFVNNDRIEGPWIPGIALCEAGLAEDASSLPYHYRQLMFRTLAVSSGKEVLGLRQWFFAPLNKNVVSAGKVVKVRIERSNAYKSGTVFCHYEHDGQAVIPHLAAYSFDKAFYGVESDNGLSDPRLDQLISIPGLTKSKISPNVFIISPKSQRHRNDTSTAPKLISKIGDLFLHAPNSTVKTVSLPTVPGLKLNDTLLFRIRGVVMTDGPSHPCGLQAWAKLSSNREPDGSERLDTYLSWSTPTRIPATNKPLKFDFAVPLSRSAFDDKYIRELELVFMRDSEAISQSTHPVHLSGSVRFQDVSAEMSVIQENPSLSNKDVF